jgi:hypothetical protein
MADQIAQTAVAAAALSTLSPGMLISVLMLPERSMIEIRPPCGTKFGGSNEGAGRYRAVAVAMSLTRQLRHPANSSSTMVEVSFRSRCSSVTFEASS